MDIKVDPQILPLDANKKPAGQGATLVDELSDQFSKMLDDVNRLQIAADKKIEEFATSKTYEAERAGEADSSKGTKETK